MTPEFIVLDDVAWTARPLAEVEMPAVLLEARFGPPSARDLDSNGVGLFDAHCLRFPCGLEVSLWRFHPEPSLRPISSGSAGLYLIHANQQDLEHVVFHLHVPAERTWVPSAPAPRTVIVMRADDNGQDAEVTRVTSRCEGEAIVRAYEARAHKQSYWLATTGG